MSIPYWPSSGKVTTRVTMSPEFLWETYFDNFFSSMPFLWSVAMKSVSGLDIWNWISKVCGAKISASWWVSGISPNSLVALAGPHSPDAQSGRGTITVCRSSQTILNLQTDLNFMGSPVRYSWGVTALAKMSSKREAEQGAWTRNATVFPTTDWNIQIINVEIKSLVVHLLAWRIFWERPPHSYQRHCCRTWGYNEISVQTAYQGASPVSLCRLLGQGKISSDFHLSNRMSRLLTSMTYVY